MAQGWSSLPADLVNRVADCLLATNDLDCYSDMRAVCHHWRSVTADPGSNQDDDPRFRPSRWVMLDEDKASSAITDGPFLFVNTSTGRFLRRRLPLVRDRDGYVFVTSTTDGLLVLAAMDSVPPTRAACVVLNPFTGSLTRFAAPIPDVAVVAAEVVGPSPTLVLVSVIKSCDANVYWAEPQSESFSVERYHNYPASRLPLIAAAVAATKHAAVGREHDRRGNKCEELLCCGGCRCYIVPLPLPAGGDMWVVFKCPRSFAVYKFDAAGNVMTDDDVSSIGSLALFLGVRCLAVDADCFPTIEPNCIYFQACDNAEYFICKLAMPGTSERRREPEFVEKEAAADYYMRIDLDGSIVYRGAPFTLTQILSNYVSVPYYYRSRLGMGASWCDF